MQPQPELFAQVANFIWQKRDEIIEKWIKEIQHESAISTVIKLSHQQVVDHMPELFEDICRLLREPVDHYRLRHARTHGLYRWQEGYKLDELLLELGVFRIVLLEYLIPYLRSFPETTVEIEVEVRKRLHRFLNDASVASAQQYSAEQELVTQNYQTRMEQLNQELREREAFLQRILENTPDCIKVLDLNGQLLYMNPGGQRVMEVDDIEKCVNSHWVEFWQGEGHLSALAAIETAKAGDQAHFEGFCPTMKGTPKWWDVTVTPITNERNEIIQLLSISRDITKQKEAEQQRRKSEERFRRLFESNIIGIHFADLDGRIIDANDAFLEMVGYHKADLQAKTLRWDEITPASFSAADQRAISQLKTTGVCQPFEKEFICKDGYRIPVLAGGALLAESRHEVVAYFIDLTERKRLEAELREQAAETEQINEKLAESNHHLEQINNSRMLFMRTIAHEMGNLLNAIVNAAALLRTNINEQIRDKMFTILQRNSKDMRTLLDQLLDYSAILAGQEQLQIEPVSLLPIISEVQDTFRPLAESKGLQFNIELDQSISGVFSDALKIKRILNNLISNAIKYTIRGEVKLAVNSVDQENYKIIVTDSGDGIAQEDMGRIFAEFQRFNTNSEISGTGLGLAITKRLIDLLGGQINVTSQVSKGSSFEVVLPKINYRKD